MEKEKNKWETPKLICLYRGRPEEVVLAACKRATSRQGPESNPCTTSNCLNIHDT